VLDELNATLRTLSPDAPRLRKRDSIRARLADGATVDDLLAVIAYAADECRRKPEVLVWLNAETPFRPRSWERRLAAARAWRATSRPTGPRLDLDETGLDAKRREAAEWEARRRGEVAE
jgi:hypothetical protein